MKHKSKKPKKDKPLTESEKQRKAKDRNKKRDANHGRREKRDKKMNQGGICGPVQNSISRTDPDDQ